jgi:hypothetical protein
LRIHAASYLTYLLPSLYAAAFVRRTTSSTDLHPLLKRSLYLLATVSDKVDQLLAHGRWFSPGTPASSTTKTGRHDIAEIFLKVALNTINQSSIIILLNVHREVCRITRKKTHLSTINNVHLTVAYPVYKSEGLLQPPRSRHPSSRVAAHSS